MIVLTVSLEQYVIAVEKCPNETDKKILEKVCNRVKLTRN